MFLHRAYLLPDYVTHNMLPKLFIRIRSIEVTFKEQPDPMYIAVDENKLFEVNTRMRQGTTVSCDVNLFGEHGLASWYVSAGWKRGKFQLWVHNVAGGVFPQFDGPALEIANWNIYEYSLYAEPTGDAKCPHITDRPIDNYETLNEIVVNENTSLGLEIIERLKANNREAPELVAAVDLSDVGDDEKITTVILSSCNKVIGHLSFRDTASIQDMCKDLVEIVPIELWCGCEPEMMQIADFLAMYRAMDVSIPRVFNTRNFSTESSHCTKARSVFKVENGVPKFDLFTNLCDPQGLKTIS